MATLISFIFSLVLICSSVIILMWRGGESSSGYPEFFSFFLFVAAVVFVFVGVEHTHDFVACIK